MNSSKTLVCCIASNASMSMSSIEFDGDDDDDDEKDGEFVESGVGDE